jgi:SAM-dependent methyltransferase
MADRSGRATSFGAVAEEYNRFRPGPPPEVVDWLLPDGARAVVDLGAGTGALTRLLVGRVPRVISVEPDPRMRQVLEENLPSATVLEGRGDDIPLEDGETDAVLVASAWHWMDTEATLAEIARVLRPNGRLGVVWAGADRRQEWVASFLTGGREGRPGSTSPADGSEDARSDDEQEADEHRRWANHHRLVIPPGLPFAEPEHEEFTWTRTMTIDDLVGLTGTYSRVITLPPHERRELLDSARLALAGRPELAGGGRIELPFRATCWRTSRSR